MDYYKRAMILKRFSFNSLYDERLSGTGRKNPQSTRRSAQRPVTAAAVILSAAARSLEKANDSGGASVRELLYGKACAAAYINEWRN